MKFYSKLFWICLGLLITSHTCTAFLLKEDIHGLNLWFVNKSKSTIDVYDIRPEGARLKKCERDGWSPGKLGKIAPEQVVHYKIPGSGRLFSMNRGIASFSVASKGWGEECDFSDENWVCPIEDGSGDNLRMLVSRMQRSRTEGYEIILVREPAEL